MLTLRTQSPDTLNGYVCRCQKKLLYVDWLGNILPEDPLHKCLSCGTFLRIQLTDDHIEMVQVYDVRKCIGTRRSN